MVPLPASPPVTVLLRDVAVRALRAPGPGDEMKRRGGAMMIDPSCVYRGWDDRVDALLDALGEGNHG